MSERSSMPISDIKVGQRIRKDMGDLAGLAESIEDLGLLNPVTVDEDGRLLAGARRLAACKRLRVANNPGEHCEVRGCLNYSLSAWGCRYGAKS